jgi:exonuclease III
METTCYEKQERNPSTNQKEDSHKKRMPILTTKIIGSKNYVSLIPLNINGLNYPIKRQTNRLAIQTGPNILLLTETHLREKERHYLRVKGWKTIFQAYGLKKQAGVAILISNKINFQPTVIKKDTQYYSKEKKNSKRNSQF